MSTFDPTKTIPRPISWHGFARNTLPVMGALGKKILTGINHIVAYRRKLFFSDCMDIQSIRAGVTGTEVLWHGKWHAGEGAKFLVAEIGMAPLTTGTDGEVFLTVGGTDTDKLHQAASSGSDIATDFSFGRIEYDISASADTSIEWSLSVVDFARPFSLGLYEVGETPVDTTNGGTVDQGVGVGSPITDGEHADLHPDLFDLWKHNASHLFSWSRQTSAAITYATSGTYTNWADGTTTGGAAVTAPGFNLVTTRHDRVNHDVPILFAVKGSMASGVGTASAKIVDTTNTTLLEITGIDTTDQWWTATGTITAGSTFVTVEVTTSGAINLELDAIAIYQYLA